MMTSTLQNNFWQDVLQTFGKLPLSIKLAWMMAPPMALLVVIALVLMMSTRFTVASL
ncbi:MAG: hypothetical protein JJ858_07325 [Rhizobiaceae bacterium]|nr:hypothetical protein [Rhizobiaceae bacterium]